MNSDVIQFQCSACQSVLTVPMHMAGVSGPCPICGETVCSPSTTPSEPPSLFAAPQAPAPVEPQPPSAPWNAPQPEPVATAGFELPSADATPNHLGGLTGQLSGFLNPMPGIDTPSLGSPTPAWEQQSNHAPQPAPFHDVPLEAPHPPVNPQSTGTLLPPRRAEGQSPVIPAAATLPASPIPWGGALQPRTVAAEAGTGVHDSFPQFPVSAPLQDVHPEGQPLQQRQAGALPPSEAPNAPDFPSSQPGSVAIPHLHAGQTSRKQPPKYSRRPDFMFFGLALLFLAGSLAAAGWLFREPLKALVQRFGPGTTPPAIATAGVVPEKPRSREQPVQSEPQAVPAPAPAIASFDPAEAISPIPGAFGAADSNPLGAMPRPNLSDDLLTGSVASPSATVPTNDLMVEVPPKAIIPGSAEDNPVLSPASLAADPVLDISEELPAADQEVARAAGADLIKFLKAANWQERREFALASEHIQPLMERYYSLNADGPIAVDSIGLVRLDRNPQIGGGTHVIFGVSSKNWEYPIPVMLEAGPAGYRADWVSFVEFKDRLLEKFFQEYQEGSVRFHVGITRRHYFEDDVPNASSKHAFSVSTAPPNPFLTTVFLDKASPLARDLQEKIQWGAQVWAIVELEWMKAGTQQWVELAGVPQLNWYSVPGAPKETAGPPPAPKRALPAGR